MLLSVSLQAPPHLLSLHLADAHYMVGDQVPFFQHRWENQHVLRSQCQWCRIVTAWKTFFSLHLVLTTACPRYFFVKYHFNHVLEKAVAPRSSTLAWRTPWMEEPGRLQSMGSLRVRHDWATSLWLFTFMLWRRKCNPLQYSCLENPRDSAAWWAAISGITRSRTRLKQLSSSSSNMVLQVNYTSKPNKFIDKEIRFVVSIRGRGVGRKDWMKTLRRYTLPVISSGVVMY